ncbi:PemK family transcriptional regulator [Suicoccus acidiformans]|uniref:PemK family transcriptional regulator n=1 Tax=Suicoccus acidiformans TaxID=2036206 RepID=A0A347WMA4_9LACT|nr:type II toxin-antitoxin system PemK/MazF family toxin [Suicoccus acidiformans]AXY26211.1 PemK family transcriptional regulator [Suicoccus acidiformans]
MSYIPEKGDIVWLDFDPAAGKEIQKCRPALVISHIAFNRTTYFAVVCPITTTFRKFPTHVPLPKQLNTAGYVVVSQLKSIDFKVRNIAFIEKVPTFYLKQIDQLVEYIFSKD